MQKWLRSLGNLIFIRCHCDVNLGCLLFRLGRQLIFRAILLLTPGFLLEISRVEIKVAAFQIVGFGTLKQDGFVEVGRGSRFLKNINNNR